MDANSAFGSQPNFNPPGIGPSQNLSTLMSSNSSFGIPAPMFGQSSGASGSGSSGQSTVFGQSTFSLNAAGQAPLFGQSGGIAAMTSAGQNSLFGQPFGKSGAPFGTHGSLFGQSGGVSFATASRQTPLFGQAVGTPSIKGTGQAPLFGQSNATVVTSSGQAPVFGQNIGNAPAASTIGQISVFGQGAGTSSGSSPGQTSVFGHAVLTAAATINSQTPVFTFNSGTPAGDSAGKGSIFGQNTSVFTTSSSGQNSLFGQNTGLSVGSNVGQTHSFGQNTGITGVSSSGQIPVLGNQGMSSTTSGNQVSVFGNSANSSLISTGSVPLFGQNTERSAVPSKGQVPLFGQSGISPGVSTAAQLPEPTQAASGQPLGFGQPSAFSPAAGSPQTSTFSQLLAKNAAVTVVDKPGFGFKTSLGTSSSEVTGSASGKSDFSFKPPENMTFKPIFNVDSDTQITPSSFSFSQPGTSGPGGPGLSGKLSEAPSTNSSASFSFSQQGRNTDSSFNFVFPKKTSVEEEKMSVKPVFGSSPANFGKLNVFSGSGKIDEDTEVGKSHMGSSSSAVIKGLKRKEEGRRSPKRSETRIMEKSELGSLTDLSSAKRHKKQLRPAVGGNLFSRALRDVFKSNSERDRGRSSSRESMTGDERSRSSSTESRRENLPPQELERTPRTSSLHPRPPGSSAAKEDPRNRQITDSGEKVPSSRSLRCERSSSFSGSSFREITAIQCKNIPGHLNKKDLVKKHFSAFGKVQRVFCNPSKNMAVVHFHDHASANRAKIHGTTFRMKKLNIFWQKKRSPGKKEHPEKEAENLERLNNEENFQLSPVRKLLTRSPAVGSGTTSKSKESLLTSSATKMLQFDAETESSLEGQVSEISTSFSLPSSLNSLVGVTAESPFEKYRVLEQRDRIMRQAARVKRTELDKAKVLVGTCPDMCPEKERYMRETQNRLSIFETVQGTNEVDHGAAVKEYSRSSADQEEPLPHELRPLPVLVMTMNYLVTKVMNNGVANLREWYDFLWNRTRGIRKDVTQQHLCDPETVSLIEKCTRFHILCAHYMCEEPVSSFDAKINNENLTKCLQTLKEMYHDLSKKGMHCPNEAEFRCYSILLRLDKGDILREAQQFQPAIRNSQDVKFAIQAFAAFNSNNFVRFFKLARAATYLNACILHRYFNPVRVLALKILTTAYTVSTQRSASFPVDSMVHMLLFLNDAEATNFLKFYGLTVSEGCVELNRQTFQEAENNFLPKKCVLIEQKCSISAGEAVNGGPLPLIPVHVPFSSFNSANKYKGESVVTEPASASQRFSCGMSAPPLVGQQEKKEQWPETSVTPVKVQPSPVVQQSAQYLFQPIRPTEPSSQPKPITPPPVYTDEDISSVAERLLEEVVEVNCKTLAKAGAEYANTALSVSERAVEQVVAEVTLECLQNVCGEEFNAEQARLKEERRKAEEERCRAEEERRRVEEEKRQIEEARRRREALEQFVSSFSQVLCSELTEEVLIKSFQDVAETELLCAVEKDRADRIARCSDIVCSNLLEVTLDEVILQIARGTLKQLRCCAKYMQRWREVVVARKKLRRQMRAFPAGPCGVDPLHKLKALLPSARLPDVMAESTSGVLHLQHAGNLAVSCTRLLQMRQETNYKMRIHYFLQQLLCEASWTPLDVASLVAESLPSPREQIFWKLVLMVPGSEDIRGFEEINSVLADWLQAKFTESELSNDVTSDPKDQIQTLSLYSSYRHTKGHLVNLHVCVKNNVVLYKRFIDDLIFICRGDMSEFLDFFEMLNNNEHNLSFSYEVNRNEINFLDLTLLKKKIK
ncbi:germinal-center associated nuclear protein-like [Protopterus annectens]|uniref:germinal-center associated nuclear protein-like n=1 Tax=Protopterus annectens TaxID=7888 RepID=UPI001CFBDD8C|nr:germinal-center associated nuclear protein-like [Protopterus annectens]